MSAYETWKEEVRKRREEDEELWAELDRTVSQMVTELESGDREAAIQSGERACDMEYELLLNCNITGTLLKALELELPEDKTD